MMLVSDLPTQWFLNAAFVLTAGAFLLRDILWLRTLTIMANFCLIYVAYHGAVGPLWPNIYYYVGLIMINGLHAAYLVYERTQTRLNEEEQRVRDSAFRALDPVAVKKLLRAGQWLSASTGEVLTREGEIAERVFLIAEGEASVKLKGKTLTKLTAGRFVGEISYLTDGPASATVIAAGPIRCVSWHRESLRRLLGRNKNLFSAMYAAFGTDLSAKLAADDVMLARGLLDILRRHPSAFAVRRRPRGSPRPTPRAVEHH